MKRKPLDERTDAVLERLVDVMDIESRKMLKLARENEDKLVPEATLRLPEVLRALITLQKFNFEEEPEDLNASDEELIEKFVAKKGWKLVKE